MHLPIKVKSHNNISKWQLGFNSAFEWLSHTGTAGHSEWNWSFQTHAIILQPGKL
jgi:hypothetical protein